MRRSHFLTSLLLTSAAACGPNDTPPDGTAEFAAMTAEQRDQSIEVAIGGGAILPYFAVLEAEFANIGDESCPERTDDGDVTTFAARGCTNADSGVTYDGTITATNTPLFSSVFGDEIERDAPMSVELDGWSNSQLTIDGRLEQSLAMPDDGDRYITEVDYTAGNGDKELVVRLDADCVQGAACALTGWAETPAGIFSIEGEIDRNAQPPRGWLVLDGVDQLRLELDGVNWCGTITIDGEPANEYCFQAPPAAPEVLSGAVSCGDTGDGVDMLSVTASVEGTTESVWMRVYDPSTGNLDSLDVVEVSYDPETDVHTYEGAVPVADTAFDVCLGSDYAFTVELSSEAAGLTCVAFNDETETFPECQDF